MMADHSDSQKENTMMQTAVLQQEQVTQTQALPTADTAYKPNIKKKNKSQRRESGLHKYSHTGHGSRRCTHTV